MIMMIKLFFIQQIIDFAHVLKSYSEHSRCDLEFNRLMMVTQGGSADKQGAMWPNDPITVWLHLSN